MRTADYIDIFNATAHACRLQMDGTGVALADSDDFVALRDLHSDALKEIWEEHYWPDLLRTEKRYYRPLWLVGTTYAAPTLTTPQEVYYPGPGKYFQSLVANTGQAPSTLSGTTWTTNTAYWAECDSAASAQVYSSTKAYVRGDRAYNPATDRIYQLYAATSTGNATTDATKWGVVTPFDPYVAYAQSGQTAFDHPIQAWDADPRITPAANVLPTRLSEKGLQFTNPAPAFAWVQYRLRCPVLTGLVYNATDVYFLNQQFYYSSATSRGNFWTATATSDPADTPENSVNFEQATIPHAFRKYLIEQAAGEYLLAAEEDEQAQFHLARAEREKSRLVGLYFGQLGQRQPTQVLTR